MFEATAWIVGLLVAVAMVMATGSEDSMVTYVSKTGFREENGKRVMDDIMARSKLPRYGECWTAALEDLKIACKVMDAEIQSKLAFAFTSCFVEMLGFPPYLCDKSTPINECIKHLDQRGYNTFLEYFLHTQDMCFFLMNQVWQEETDKTVNNLAATAHGVTKNLEATIKTQDQILAAQQESLKVQGNMVKDNNALYQTVLRVKQVFDEFRLTVDSHQAIFMGIFEKLEKMQQLVSWIQGEMSLLDMFGFYIAALFFGFIVTCPRQTSEARFPLIILVTTAFMAERFLYNRLVAHDYTPEDINLWLWYYRRGACIIAFLIILVTAYTYRNSDNDVHVKLDKIMLIMEAQKNQLKLHEQTEDCEEENDDGSDTESDTSGFSQDSESCSSDSSSHEVEPGEIKALQDEIKLYSSNKENRPLGSKNSAIDDDLPRGPPVLTSTPKEQSFTRYNLRARKVTPVNPIVNTESPKEFAKKVLHLGKPTPNSSQKVKFSQSSFYSSGDEL